MRTYTEEELEKALLYACCVQKAQDYHSAANLLEEGNMNIEKLLDELYDLEETSAKNIKLEEFNEWLDKSDKK